MTNKRYKWHTQWRLDGSKITHSSGLIFERKGQGLVLEQSSLSTFAEHELARGVPTWQHDTRIETLRKEAMKWASDPRNKTKDA